MMLTLHLILTWSIVYTLLYMWLLSIHSSFGKHQKRSNPPQFFYLVKHKNVHAGSLFFFSFWPRLGHVEVTRPGLESVPQQQPETLQWQCWMLNYWVTRELPGYYWLLNGGRGSGQGTQDTSKVFVIFLFWGVGTQVFTPYIHVIEMPKI